MFVLVECTKVEFTEIFDGIFEFDEVVLILEFIEVVVNGLGAAEITTVIPINTAIKINPI